MFDLILVLRGSQKTYKTQAPSKGAKVGSNSMQGSLSILCLTLTSTVTGRHLHLLYK